MEQQVSQSGQNWAVYMLRCADDTFYTGVTTNLQRRLDEHNGVVAGKGARYTRGRRPVTLVWWEDSHSRSSALKREYAIKQLRRSAKLQLCDA